MFLMNFEEESLRNHVDYMKFYLGEINPEKAFVNRIVNKCKLILESKNS